MYVAIYLDSMYPLTRLSSKCDVYITFDHGPVVKGHNAVVREPKPRSNGQGRGERR